MEAIIFCGIQGSGKTSFYKEQFLKTHIRISLDMLKTRNKEEQFLALCLSSKQRFVIDNTNPTKEERKKYILLAREHKFKVVGYYFHSDLFDALNRNSQRQGKENIPEVGVRGTFNKLEIPLIDEGFDELFIVELKNNAFVINKIDE
ncbi:MAG: ATP-binding protein [Bacteroidota bacterium]|nr:ATP-binding protein [Bacteroidota bacterium]